MNETHTGNLNRSIRSGPQGEEGTCGTKSNDPEATLRKGNLPKSEEVTTVDRDKNKGAAIKAADKQNHSDGKEGKEGLNQQPAGSKYPTTTGSGN